MPKAKRKMPSGKLEAGPARRDQAVLDESGNRTESFLYDFAQDGGAVGALTFGRKLPAGAVVTNIYSDEQTAFTSGGAATIQVKAGPTALTDAIAFDTGFTATAESQALASSATAIKLSAESELSLAIATAALTAGKCRFFVKYMLPNDA